MSNQAQIFGFTLMSFEVNGRNLRQLANFFVPTLAEE
jgi:hypothetical protein